MHIESLCSSERRIVRFDRYFNGFFFAWIETKCLRPNLNSPVVRDRKHAVAFRPFGLFPPRPALLQPSFWSLAWFTALGQFGQVVRISFQREPARHGTVIANVELKPRRRLQRLYGHVLLSQIVVGISIVKPMQLRLHAVMAAHLRRLPIHLEKGRTISGTFHAETETSFVN